jgi:hypothetical protein
MAFVQKPIAIPEPTNEPDALWRTTQALKEAVEMLQGQRGRREAALKADLEAAIANFETGTSTGTAGVDSFNTRTGAVTPQQSDYDSFFLTQAEADALYEAVLGNPAADGYHLVSTAAGVRSWEVVTGGAPTHTGEVTGDTNLTVDVTAITNRTDVVADAADDVAIHDDTDGTHKKVNLSSITDAGYF